jgi:hypothetical protein
MSPPTANPSTTGLVQLACHLCIYHTAIQLSGPNIEAAHHLQPTTTVSKLQPTTTVKPRPGSKRAATCDAVTTRAIRSQRQPPAEKQRGQTGTAPTTHTCCSDCLVLLLYQQWHSCWCAAIHHTDCPQIGDVHCTPGASQVHPVPYRFGKSPATCTCAGVRTAGTVTMMLDNIHIQEQTSPSPHTHQLNHMAQAHS